MNCSGPISQRFPETRKPTGKRHQLTANTHLGSTLCSPFHVKGSEKPSKSFRRLRLMWPLLSHKSSHLGRGYELDLDPIRIFEKHSVMISASSEGMIILVQNLGSSGSQFFGN